MLIPLSKRKQRMEREKKPAETRHIRGIDWSSLSDIRRTEYLKSIIVLL